MPGSDQQASASLGHSQGPHSLSGCEYPSSVIVGKIPIYSVHSFFQSFVQSFNRNLLSSYVLEETSVKKKKKRSKVLLFFVF